MLIKGESERKFAYEAHAVCDSRGLVLDVEVTTGNAYGNRGLDEVKKWVRRKYAALIPKKAAPPAKCICQGKVDIYNTIIPEAQVGLVLKWAFIA